MSDFAANVLDVDSFWLFILGVVIFLVGLAVSIGLHEIGHLVPAKIFKVRVGQYMIGFGPKIFSKKVGETEYGLKLIPLGGYISMAGMFPPEKKAQQEAKKPSRLRKLFGRMVQDAHDASAETMKGVDASRAFYHLPVWKRIIIMIGGPFMNLVLGFVLFAILFMGIGQVQATTTVQTVAECVVPVSSTATECSDEFPAGPALAGGLLAGDRIVSINGEQVTQWSSGTEVIRASAGKPLTFVVDRDGVEKTLTITPVTNEIYATNADGTPVLDAAGKPTTVTVGYIGIGPAQGFVQQPITAVFPVMWQTVAGTANMIATLPQRVVDVGESAFTSAPRDPNGPVSVVGIGRVAGEIASTDQVPVESKVATILGLLASLNIALFIFNLVPLLPLDGGHIAGAIWEAIRRGVAKLRHKADPGPFDTAKLMPLTFVVVSLLIAMSALFIYADIVKPISLFG